MTILFYNYGIEKVSIEVMKKLLIAIFISVAGIISIACSKEATIQSLVGTWDIIQREYRYSNGDTKIEKLEGDYCVITEQTITFYYGEGHHGFDDGVSYKFSFQNPHLFIVGINLFDVVSFTGDTMVLKANIMDNDETFRGMTLKRR